MNLFINTTSRRKKNLEWERRRIKCKLQILWAASAACLLKKHLKALTKQPLSWKRAQHVSVIFLLSVWRFKGEKSLKSSVQFRQFETFSPRIQLLLNSRPFRFFSYTTLACMSFNNRARALYIHHPLIKKLSGKKESAIRIHEAFYAVSTHKRAPFGK